MLLSDSKPSPCPEKKSIFITVGSTRFDDLISVTSSPSFFDIVAELGYTQVTFQYGNSPPPSCLRHASVAHVATSAAATPSASGNKDKMVVKGFNFQAQGVEAEMKEATFIICHAGSGSILEALRLQKPTLVVVNESLMDNHQTELAKELHSLGYIYCTNTRSLLSTLKQVNLSQLKPFPSPDQSTFGTILQNEFSFKNI